MNEYLFSDEFGRKVAYFFTDDEKALQGARNMPKRLWKGIITIKRTKYLSDGTAYLKTIGWVLPFKRGNRQSNISSLNQCNYGRKH